MGISDHQLAIIAGGPAGLRAAEVASAAGIRTTLYESKRSVGRKFLIAGKGGFNMTHSENLDSFASRYRGPGQPTDFWLRALQYFDNHDIRTWADGLGVETFVASSGRVYPKALKAAPLLRAWLKKIKAQGTTVEVNHHLTDLEKSDQFHLQFTTPHEPRSIQADAVILALGGGSWPRTGSDGHWTSLLNTLGLTIAPLTAANCGWEVAWPVEIIAQHEGHPLKNLTVRSGSEQTQGELVVTRYGLEGGPIYKLGPALKRLPEPLLEIDFKPTFTHERLVAKMESARRNFLGEARVRWKLNPAACALLEAFHGPFDSADSLAQAAKRCQIPLQQPRPLEEAISSAGGLMWQELDHSLSVRKLPGLFVAGEMIDWEAPTGGYLMQGCFATGTLAAHSACDYLKTLS